jgi:adenylate cyclase
MYTFHLTIIRPDGQHVGHYFSSEQTLIGRNEKCDLCLMDSMVSRNHCLILREGERFVVKDLDSRNGTWVNGRRIKNRRHIKSGDVLQIGPFRVLFEPQSSETIPLESQTLDMSHPHQQVFHHKQETSSVVEPLGIIQDYLSEASEPPPKAAPKIRRERLNRNLVTLYSIAEQLVGPEDLDEILNYIMDQIFEIWNPSQASILLLDKDQNAVPRKQRGAPGGAIIRPVSTTILNRIIKDRVSILTDNALEDPRFEMGDSVVIDGIRSVMAAPIWEDQTILGAIYVDRLDIVGGFLAEDLDLLTAMGHQTAVAIQRWKLAEQLREEAVKSAIIRQNLKRFHANPVVDQILKGAADLEVKETVATIFFCDIVGFTALCESSSPEALQEVLNLFCKTVNRIIFDEEGTLDKFIGDAAMAIFGAPLAQEDAPVRAVRSALRIREALQKSMQALPESLRFQVRYGINTGPAIVGNFGSDERMDYTILGHSVNVASRISQVAEPEQILIGQDTYESLKGKNLFAMNRIRSRPIKGLQTKVRLFEVSGSVAE